MAENTQQAPTSEVPVFAETWTTAALDGARISCGTAAILVMNDPKLPEEMKVGIINSLDQAQQWLDDARAGLRSEVTTSVHIVTPEAPGRIILPS